MLPEHVHAIRRPSGTVHYYYHRHRGTARAEKPVRIHGDPSSAGFWREYEAIVAASRPAKAGGIAAMIDAYIAAPRFAALAASTQREYRRYMTTLRDAIGGFDPDDVAPRDIATFRDEMGKTPAKANAYIRAIAALYDWGKERGFARSNPATGITKLRIGTHAPWPAWAWDAAMAHFRPELRLACRLGRYTGQRLGDVLKLRITDIVTDADGIDGFDLVQQKTGKHLFVPVAAELVEDIEDVKRRGRIGFIVGRDDGSGFTVDQFHAMWGREMRRPDCRPIRAAGLSFHGLRKAIVVAGAERGISPLLIGSITGQTVQTVEFYSRGASQKRLAKEAMKKL